MNHILSYFSVKSQLDQDVKRYPHSEEFFKGWMTHLSTLEVSADTDYRKEYSNFFQTFFNKYYIDDGPDNLNLKIIYQSSSECLYNMALLYTDIPKAEKEIARKNIHILRLKHLENIRGGVKSRIENLYINIGCAKGVGVDTKTMKANLEKLETRLSEIIVEYNIECEIKK